MWKMLWSGGCPDFWGFGCVLVFFLPLLLVVCVLFRCLLVCFGWQFCAGARFGGVVLVGLSWLFLGFTGCGVGAWVCCQPLATEYLCLSLLLVVDVVVLYWFLFGLSLAFYKT